MKVLPKRKKIVVKFLFCTNETAALGLYIYVHNQLKLRHLTMCVCVPFNLRFLHCVPWGKKQKDHQEEKINKECYFQDTSPHTHFLLLTSPSCLLSLSVSLVYLPATHSGLPVKIPPPTSTAQPLFFSSPHRFVNYSISLKLEKLT